MADSQVSDDIGAYNWTMLIDLHSHTAPRSYDALQTPDELIIEAKGLGLDALCLTEHDAFWEHHELRRLSRRYGLLLMPGCEVNTYEGHFLAFGLEGYVFGMHKLSFLWQQVQQAGGALVAAHPYRRRGIGKLNRSDMALKVVKAGGEDAFKKCHAIEGLNGRGTKDENSFSLALAQHLGMSATGGSDSHARGDVGACATQFSAKIEGLDDLVRELRGGRFSAVAIR